MTELVFVRHGESPRDRLAPADQATSADAAEAGDPRPRDADVPLSGLGVQQSLALARAWAGQGMRFDTAWASPYARTRQTAELILAELADPPVLRQDERLRDREPGVRDLLPRADYERCYPQEGARWAWLGKFYYRPPGGESGADVVLRVRSVLPELLEGGAERVLVVCHDAVVHAFRYVCERLDEADYVRLRTESVPNASVTTLTRGRAGNWAVTQINVVSHLTQIAEEER